MLLFAEHVGFGEDRETGRRYLETARKIADDQRTGPGRLAIFTQQILEPLGETSRLHYQQRWFCVRVESRGKLPDITVVFARRARGDLKIHRLFCRRKQEKRRPRVRPENVPSELAHPSVVHLKLLVRFGGGFAKGTQFDAARLREPVANVVGLQKKLFRLEAYVARCDGLLEMASQFLIESR